MIIANGTIELKEKTVQGIDLQTGYPVRPSDVAWSDPIPCQYYANQSNSKGQVNGEHYTIATYTVLIEEQPFSSEQLRLKDRSGNIVGEYSIISVKPLDTVCQIMILI